MQKSPLMVRETPAARLRTVGPQALSTMELIALVAKCSTTAAMDVLTTHRGSLRQIAAHPVATLQLADGIGPAGARSIHAALELGRRMAAEERGEGSPVRWPRDVFELMSLKMEDLPVEEFHVLVLDSQHRLDRDITVTRGLLNSSLVHPREVFREAIAEKAAAIILVHNHPSGDPTPSPDDRVVTAKLIEAGKVLDIPVQDHVIIGRGRYISFAEAGLL